MLEPGQRLDQGTVYYIDGQGTHTSISVSEVFALGRVAVFGGPAPYSRLDTAQALDWQRASSTLLQSGIDRLVAVYVQDAFVVNEFRKTIAAAAGNDLISYYADGDGFFVRSAGLDLDFTYQGLGMRSHRWAAVVDHGLVEWSAIDSASEIKLTSSAAVLSWLEKLRLK